MSEHHYYDHSVNHLPDVFDFDHGSASSTHHHDGLNGLEIHHPAGLEANHHVFHSPDPLKHVHQYNFKPMVLDLGDMHFVKPHFVQGYIKEDGTVVKGYFRDGDGNTFIDRPLGAGGGYYAHNPGTAGL